LKKNSSKPSSQIVGYWAGTAQSSAGGSPWGNNIRFYANGTLLDYDFYSLSGTDTVTCQIKAYGNYTLIGDTIKFTVDFNTPLFSPQNLDYYTVGTINRSVNPETMNVTFTCTNDNAKPPGSIFLTQQCD
jgi:hypothetical protein